MNLTLSAIPAQTWGTIQQKARTLHADGYRAIEVVDGVYEIRGGRSLYSIIDGVCNCPFAQIYGLCKHAIGIAALMQAQDAEAVVVPTAQTTVATITVFSSADAIERRTNELTQARRLMQQTMQAEALREEDEAAFYAAEYLEGQRAA